MEEEQIEHLNELTDEAVEGQTRDDLPDTMEFDIRAVMSAHTDVILCEDISKIHKYVEWALNSPVFTNQMAQEDLMEKLREENKEHFKKAARSDSVKVELTRT